MPDAPDAREERLEEIVAYLDGELSAGESARVERQLATDESYRQELQSVERAWKALDELPLAMVDDRFSRTTMQMAVQTALAEVEEKTIALPIQRRRRRLSNVLVAAAAASLGFLVIRLAWQNPDRMLLADLPVIDNVDVYSQFDQPEFLRTLRRELGAEFDELAGASAESAGRLQRVQAVTDASLRDDWLEKLDAQERTVLRAKFNRFRELPPQEQQRLRDLHQQVVSAKDAPQLQQAMLVYQEWLDGLPPARQFELRNMPADQRVRTVREWTSEMRDDAVLALSEDELRRLVRKIRKPLDDLMRTAARNLLKSDDKRRPSRPGEPRPPQMTQLPRVLAMQFATGVARKGEFQTAVVEALPQRSRAAFEALPPREKVDRVMTWMRQAEALQGEVSQEALELFFAEELDAQTRAELLSLPPGDMQQALRRLYRRQTGRGFGAPWAWGGRGGRRPEPGSPGWGFGRAGDYAPLDDAVEFWFPAPPSRPDPPK